MKKQMKFKSLLKILAPHGTDIKQALTFGLLHCWCGSPNIHNLLLDKFGITDYNYRYVYNKGGIS